MPITVVEPFGNSYGPGLFTLVTTDLVGPLPTDLSWHVTVTAIPSEDVLLQQVLTAGDRGASDMIGWQRPAGEIGLIEHTAPSGTAIAVQVVAHSTEFGTIDTGEATRFVWEPTAAAWALTSKVLETSAGGGLTAEQAAQLADTERRTQTLGEPVDLVLSTASGIVTSTLAQIFSRQTLDQLTLSEVTSGPTCEPVRALVSSWATAAIVRVTTIGEDLTPRTPDADWYFPDLAVLRIFRGGDLQYRRGIHTPTFMVDQPWQWSWQFLNQLQVLGNPPDITIAVDWRPGCCGQVFLMSLP